MISRKLAITGTVAACAACCAPLVVPLLWPALVAAGLVGAGSVGGGWFAGLSLDVLVCGGIALAALAGGVVWLRQKGKKQQMAVPMLVDGAQCDLDTCGPTKQAKRRAKGSRKVTQLLLTEPHSEEFMESGDHSPHPKSTVPGYLAD